MRVSSLDQRHDDCRFWDEVHRHVNTFKLIPVFRALPVLRCVRLDRNVLGLRPILYIASVFKNCAEANVAEFSFGSAYNGCVVAIRFI